MISISVVLQPDKVAPDLPTLRHLIPNFWMATASYWELMNKNLPERYKKLFQMKVHLYSWPWLFLLQREMGDFSSLLDIQKRTLISSDVLQVLVRGSVTFMKIAESGTVYKALGFFSKDFTWLLQQKAPKPPADAPVKSTFSAFTKSQVFINHLKCDLLLADPLKQSSLSLYLIGSIVKPWCMAPSQQYMISFVQLANLLIEGSVDRQPPLDFIVIGRPALVPLSVVDL